MQLSFKIGPDVIGSYKRLAYTPWHALAEFVDNSTQAYFNNRSSLDAAFAKEKDRLEVSIVYERDDDLIRIADTSVGMEREELDRALHVGFPPSDTSGRSKYGMGMKTAACWLGDEWTIRTTKLGSTNEYTVQVKVGAIADGTVDLPVTTKAVDAKKHYTVLEIRRLHRTFKGRTLGKIRDYLRSMYREDFRAGVLRLMWRGEELVWEELDEKLLTAADGKPYKKQFEFTVDGRKARGWIGILGGGYGGRANAGFSIIHCGRVVRGWPDAWRPQSLYGQLQGSNDLVNQRLVGEIHLDEFDVSHTKDDILWYGDDEEAVEARLLEYCADYRDIAKRPFKSISDERGPTSAETTAAVDEIKRELESPEVLDVINLEVVQPPDVIKSAFASVVETERTREPRFTAEVAGVVVKGYLMDDGSPNDPYFVSDSTQSSEVCVVVNQLHPHWLQLKGSEGVANYLRHCVYDALAEHQARHKACRLDPDTIKLLKDRFLRVPMEIASHSGDSEADVTDHQ